MTTIMGWSEAQWASYAAGRNRLYGDGEPSAPTSAQNGARSALPELDRYQLERIGERLSAQERHVAVNSGRLAVTPSDLSARPICPRQFTGVIRFDGFHPSEVVKLRVLEDGRMENFGRGDGAHSSATGALWRLARPTDEGQWELFDVKQTWKYGGVHLQDVPPAGGVKLDDAALRALVVNAWGEPWGTARL